MAAIGSSCVNNDSHQVISVVLLRELKRFLLDLCITFLKTLFGLFKGLLLVQVLLGVGRHVQLSWELKVVVDLNANHPIKVELKSLERGDQVLGELLDAGSLERIDLLITFVALILVAILKHVTADEGLHTLRETLLVFDGHSDVQEGF